MSEMYITSAGMRIINLLVGQPPLALAEMIDNLNVTRTAITEQLSELIEAGYVERTVEKLSSRGRPRHRYGITDLSLTALFPGAAGVVVPSIWKHIEQCCGLQMAEKIQLRIKQIKASDSVEQMVQYNIGRCHPLRGNRENQYAVDLIHPYRLIFKKNGSNIQVLVIEITDYH